MRQPLTLNYLYIKTPGDAGSSTKTLWEPFLRQNFSSHRRARSGSSWKKKQAKSCFLVNSSNIRKPPGSQRGTSGPRTWLLGFTGPWDAAQGMNHGRRAVTSCYESAVCFSCSSALGLSACLPPMLPAVEAVRWVPINRNPTIITNSFHICSWSSHQLGIILESSQEPARQNPFLILTFFFC